MNKLARRFLYRIICALAIVVAVYLIVDLAFSKTFDYKIMIAFGFFIVVTIWGIVEWSTHYHVMRRQEDELRMYQLYVQPLEGLVKEIRSRQHEFDNHINAILNMHLTIDNYDELVASQSEYIKDAVAEGDHKYLPLLKISDKILAGFLYSKIVSAPDYVETHIRVVHLEILSRISESHLIEIVGTLVDNAYEACTKQYNKVIMIIDSQEDHLIFCIQNSCGEMKLSEIEKFFERGYSTKSGDGNRGFGLYQAKTLVERFGGELTVGIEELEEQKYISFKVII